MAPRSSSGGSANLLVEDLRPPLTDYGIVGISASLSSYMQENIACQLSEQTRVSAAVCSLKLGKAMSAARRRRYAAACSRPIGESQLRPPVVCTCSSVACGPPT